jgi:hypothetical protein
VCVCVCVSVCVSFRCICIFVCACVFAAVRDIDGRCIDIDATGRSRGCNGISGLLL